VPQIAETKLTDPAQTTFNAAPQPTVRDGAGLITNVNTPERQLLAARNAATDAYNIVLTIAGTGRAGALESSIGYQRACDLMSVQASIRVAK